jgi:hypothetical protein
MSDAAIDSQIRSGVLSAKLARRATMAESPRACAHSSHREDEIDLAMVPGSSPWSGIRSTARFRMFVCHRARTP